MTKYSKRIDELEIGDIIRFSSSKQPKIVETIELLKDKPYRKLSFQDIPEEHMYYDDIYVTYLGNNKEEKVITHKGYVLKIGRYNHALFNGECDELNYYVPAAPLEFLQQDFPKFVEKKMKELNKERQPQKVNYSVLYPYFDLLANDEVSSTHTNVPLYVKQQLRFIYELFEGVLDLTLEEMKTLYFERKMSKQEPKIEKSPKTKKAKDLCLGDRVILPIVGEITVTKLTEVSPEYYESVMRVEWLQEDVTRFDLIRKEAELVLVG